jgi:DnaJ-class molecular chaperone
MSLDHDTDAELDREQDATCWACRGSGEGYRDGTDCDACSGTGSTGESFRRAERASERNDRAIDAARGK